MTLYKETRLREKGNYIAGSEGLGELITPSLVSPLALVVHHGADTSSKCEQVLVDVAGLCKARATGPGLVGPLCSSQINNGDPTYSAV